ncbi:MAG: hypothetical protein ACPGUY_05305, partial [Akkermansiaceae bacterium]
AVSVLAKVFVNKEFIVETLEESINSKVEIGDVSVSALSFPAQVSLTDVELQPRGDSESDARVRIDQLDLSVSLWGLLAREINVSKITVKGCDIKSTFYEDGGHSLEELFESPRAKKGGGEKKSDKKGGGLNALDQSDFVASLGGLIIEDSFLDITLEKTGLRVRGSDVSIKLSSIRIDPKNLQATNSAKLDVKGNLRIDSVEGHHYGDLSLTGGATATLFNATTGDSEPNIEGEFKLSEDSWLNTRIPYITAAWNSLAILKKIGVPIAELPSKATFGRSKSVAAHYHLGKITVLEPLSVWIGDWELAVLKQSWLQTETDEHVIDAELLASESSSSKFKKLIGKSVSFVPEKHRDKFLNEYLASLYREERLLIELQSTGELSDPKVRAASINLDIKEAAKDYLKDKAGSLLRGLLGGDDD